MGEIDIPKHNLILIDWLCFSTKIHKVEELKMILGLSSVPWRELPGMYGYQKRDEYENIRIYYEGNENMGVCCEMSGMGCRAFETFGSGDFQTIFQLIVDNSNDINITRLDVAFDDHTGILDIKKVCDDANYYMQNYVSLYSPEDTVVTLSGRGCSVTHGTRSSESMIRIYDKAKEFAKKMKIDLSEDIHWIRVEICLRRDRALAFIKYMLAGRTIGDLFSCYLNQYLRYVTPSKTDTNKRRWKIRPYWNKLLQNSERLRFYENPGYEYRLANLDNFVEHQSGGAIQAYLEIHGIWALLDRTKKDELNPKYQKLINEYGKKKSITEFPKNHTPALQENEVSQTRIAP